MFAKLYVVQGSHPCATAERALALKGLSYQRVELVELAHMPLQRLRFGAPTVPGMVFEDGEKVLGSRAIVHRLDERVANPPLFPSDPHERARVEELERWGDEKLQSLARRICWATFRHNGRPMPSYVEGSKWPVPAAAVRAVGPIIAHGAARVHGADDSQLLEDVRAVRDVVAHVNRAIDEGTIGGESPNAADLQIAPSIRLMLTFDDLKPMIERTPAGELALRWFPDWAGHAPAGTIPTPMVPSSAPA